MVGITCAVLAAASSPAAAPPVPLLACTPERQMRAGLNVYSPGAEVTFRIPARETRRSLDYRIVDFSGRTVSRAALALPARAPGVLRYRPRRNGVYYLRYCLTTPDGKQEKGVETFSVIPPPRRAAAAADYSPFGVCFADPELMPLAGIRWHRRDFLWDAIEPRPGEFHWEETDRAVADARKHGFRLMPILDYSASWASTGPAGDPNICFYPPKLEEWGRYVSAVVSRYRGQVRHWEIWNEPDVTHVFFRGGSPKAYADLLRVAYQAAKAADPECTIIGGVTASQSVPFLEEILQHGGIEHLDVVSVHPYRPRLGSPEGTGFLEEMARLRELIVRYGGRSKPIWLTEFGWPADDLDPDASEFVQSGRVLSERTQVAYVVRFYAQALSLPYIHRLFWFVFRHPSPTFADSPDHGESLLYYDRKAKPLLVAHRVLADLLAGAKPAGSRRIGSSVLACRFRRGAEAITVVWNTMGPQWVAVSGGGRPFSITDVMHNTRRYSAAGEAVVVPCGEIPFFLQGSRARIAGYVLDLQPATFLVSADAPAAFGLVLRNPTHRTLRISVATESRRLHVRPAALSVTLPPGRMARRRLLARVRDATTAGREAVAFRFGIPGLAPLEVRRELLAVAPGALLVDDFEEGVSAWRTNAGDAHVAHSEVKESTERVLSGTHSLWWHCRSNLWNNLFRGLDGTDLSAARQVELWVFLGRPAIGAQTLTIELYDKGGAIYDHLGPPFGITQVGKWLRCIMNLDDFRRRLEDGKHGGPPDPSVLARFQINYTGGELDAFFDRIQFRR